ncbi:ankyrin repeat-containing protein NPR4-like [Salvia miltiorrhiza]|uniref:ankyrin repeat-containing protein NPR4-like n=1 Tax=Salvia miltiorrhiza TaxID=226208 RepID=UPI0025ACFE0E|nr:ankyrin repeat-containing protein NPR4-like [Salvia miltiorrhiza]
MLGMQWETGVMRRDFRLLANKLWEGIQRLGHASAVELMKNPPILHDAAKVGNVELITMLTHTYPDLVWHTDSNGYTIFHIAVKYRQANLFVLIEEIGAWKDLIAVSEDENGNNILHLAAKLGPLDRRVRRIRMLPTFRLHRETMWFKKVKSIVPPFCLEMRNKDGHTPSELFDKEHKNLLEKNTTWLRNMADSCMLISTLIFSVVFASGFAVPGGYNQNTGIPLLFKSERFAYFVIFEAVAVFFSAFSVLQFSRTMMASSEVFLDLLPLMIRNGLMYLSLSVFGVISVFMSAYFLVYVEERAPLVTSLVILLYTVLISVVFLQNYSFNRGLSRYLFPKRNRYSLFKRHAYTPSNTKKYQITHKVLDF